LFAVAMGISATSQSSTAKIGASWGQVSFGFFPWQFSSAPQRLGHQASLKPRRQRALTALLTLKARVAIINSEGDFCTHSAVCAEYCGG
jgi:hypothetical protein